MIGQTISHYRILGKLGEGGMGLVYLAEDTLLGRRVAIKTLNVDLGKQHYRQRFLREARAVSALSHPNIATVHEYGETSEGVPFIVMELVQGQTLEELLIRKELTLSRILEIVEDVAKALAEAHRSGIVHRDIKPSNVAINERGKVKVLDFGLAKHINADHPAIESSPEKQAHFATQTREGVVIGTPLYLSPEQALGLPVDARSDLFSLGSLLYECIAGRPAFSGLSAIAICANVVRDDPPPPSQFNPRVSAELDRVTLKLLAKKPEERFQSADDLLTELNTVRATLHDQTQDFLPKPVQISSGLRDRARMTLSYALQRPRYLIAAFFLTLIAGFTFWGAWQFWKGSPYHPPSDAEQYYIQGTNALRDGTYYRASQMLEQAVKLDDGFALAHARLAEAYMELGDNEGAAKEMSKAGALASTLLNQEALQLQAITSLTSGDVATAIKSYQVLVESSPDSVKPDVYIDLGRAYEKNEEISMALDNYTKATVFDGPQRPSALLHTAILRGRKLNLASATEEFEKAEKLYRAERNYWSISELLYQRGALFNKLKLHAEAREKLQTALDTAIGCEDVHQQIKALLELSSVSASENDSARAKQYAADALALAQKSGLNVFIVQVHFELGNIALSSRDLDEAERHFKRALDLTLKDKGSRYFAAASLKLASLYEQRAKPDEVLRYIEPALKFYRRGGYYKEYADSLRLSGRAKLQKGDYAGATKAFDEAVQLAVRTDNLAQVAAVHFEIGKLLADSENYPAALSHFDQSCAIYANMDSEKLEYAYSLVHRADVQWRLGRYPDAEASLNQLSAQIAILEDTNQKKLSARSYMIQAKMALSQLDFQDAIKHSRHSIGLAENGIAPYVLIEANYTLGLALAYGGDTKNGLLASSNALELASKEDEPRLLFAARLAAAEIEFAAGNVENALSDALRAQEYFARNGQKDSEWRALMIAARAAQNRNDTASSRNYLDRAKSIFSQLADAWSANYFSGYNSRRDIQRLSSLANSSVSIR